MTQDEQQQLAFYKASVVMLFNNHTSDYQLSEQDKSDIRKTILDLTTMLERAEQ